ncbi:hypothetical protein BG262_05510 [Floricoccus penangensis]|uniref:DUF1803 domain-containing protein n=1 Tax=Floricoccus penangensis TaxID=1859475 RepID=A0A9Q5NZK7_9LACT|nr:DUF1803 domain-containing protein [Floricoccus penangensis]OFI46473.1 hypothetical protein BG262_05510 [Floricoccus penangensis]
MSIKIYNENRLTKQPFFRSLIEFLDINQDVTLRAIKAEFKDTNNLDRKLEDYIQSGLIRRENRRYYNNFKVFDDIDFTKELVEESEEPNKIQILSYSKPFFLRSNSILSIKLNESQTYLLLKNEVNDLKFFFSSNFARTDDNLANYFYHVAQGIPLSTLEKDIYRIMGDVDPNYALRYMTVFLLKYTKRELVPNKKPDIFIQTLIKYGYIEAVDDKYYKINVEINDDFADPQGITFDNPEEFIAAQLKATRKIQTSFIV